MALKWFPGFAASAIAAVLVVVLSACSGQTGPGAAPLPDRVCWGMGAFAGKDVARTAGNGNKVRDDSPAMFALPRNNKGTSCHLYVDGDLRFSARASRISVEQNFDWFSWEKANPDRIKIGSSGIVWNSGAAISFTCKSPEGPYKVELVLTSGSGVGKPKAPRAYFTEMMGPYHRFAVEQLHCSA
ncbi:hypothetical protein [Streptomyces sp. NBC_01264]|uniref:hypothetical protein n=1 Tax=Streptomyces sp. NBC_01264 TaxID=2903804 RepID=UPI002254EB12|nr:hypothetical protein [Streptomyces sp. NBC_01264]MCX4778703.1 hypothetical protein [Streptomyces sp. NBC_01264]